MAHDKQALDKPIGPAHVWLVCLIGGVASIVAAGCQRRSNRGDYFSRLLNINIIKKLIEKILQNNSQKQQTPELRGLLFR
ncbi:MAG: hypothetical protein I8H67_05465 [Comamonadaceae bacterium]|nr:hypothetical protein [Comamonadaceae bacterium]